MLADKKYQVNAVKCAYKNQGALFNKLANRFHIWQIANNKGKSKYIALGHFHFAGDEYITEKKQHSVHGSMYCDFINNVMQQYADKQFTLCADFNLNPYLIGECKDQALDTIANNNSILLTQEEKTKIAEMTSVTVDGILLSLQKNKIFSAAPCVLTYHTYFLRKTPLALTCSSPS